MTAAASKFVHDLSSGDGLERSARLMRALGPAAAPIWAQLSPGEVRALTDAMGALPRDEQGDAHVAAAFTAEMDRAAIPKDGARALNPSIHHAPARHAPVWDRLSALDTDRLLEILKGQHPQTLAMIVSRLSGDASARLLRALAPQHAIDAMQRLLHLGVAHPKALTQLETHLEALLDGAAAQAPRGGHERVARIFDRLDGRSEKVLLAALESAEPGAGEKVRALMFTFDDLTGLDAAGMQTLLAAADRSSLVIALKGARETTSAAFFANMTKRASALLIEEIGALGPVRRTEIEAARRDLVTLARKLIHRGDIRTAGDTSDDELVE